MKLTKSQLKEIIREELSSLTESFDFTKLIKPGKRIKIGFTEIQYTRDKKELVISHGGNMGNSIKDSVNPNLKRANFPTIEQLKRIYPNFNETGSPNYMYTIRFKLT